MAEEAPRWRVNQQSLIGHALVEEGREVYYTPTEKPGGGTNGVGENLSPLNDAAQAIVDAQEADHIDKTVNAAKRKALAEAGDGPTESETADGLVPTRAAKGDARTDASAAKPAKGSKKASAPETPADPDDVG